MDSQELKANAIRLGMQAALMKELLDTPMWRCFLEYVEQMGSDTAERALQRGSGDYEKGVVAGIRDVMRIPENVIMWAERANQN